jgi:hypothetical protein
VSDSLNCYLDQCDMCVWLKCTHDCHGDDVEIAICGGCGAYGRLGEFHVRNGEECGEFV